MKAVANTGTLPSEPSTRQQCPPPKPEKVIRGISTPPPRRMAGVNKGAARTPPPAPQVNLHVCSLPTGFYFQANICMLNLENIMCNGLVLFTIERFYVLPRTIFLLLCKYDQLRTVRSTLKVLIVLGLGPKNFKKFNFFDSNNFMDKQCLDLSFWPPPGMQFIGHKLAVAAYIFANGLQPSEILVEDEHCTGNREALWTLRPGEEVVDDLIINLVVAMVSSNKADKQRWWLPTMFAQIAMSPAHHCKSTLDYIVAKYMGFADNLRKIYVPLHMGRHWYLMIVDMWDQNLIYLDSLKSSNERQARIDQMLEVHGLQSLGCIVDDPIRFVGIEVNDSTRMIIAVDLVMRDHNPISEEVQQKVVKFWDRNMICSYTKGVGPRKRTRSPLGPLSP
ncbi:hypothetical protein HN51_028764 [Arachis hypogaea]